MFLTRESHFSSNENQSYWHLCSSLLRMTNQGGSWAKEYWIRLEGGADNQ